MSWIIDKLCEFLNYLMGVLPMSPFRGYIKQFADLPYMGYVNWFLPIGDFVKVGVAWLGVIGLFYLYSIIMRWVKVIE